MKILHVATRHRWGGAERNLLHSVGWERDRGYEVHVALGRDSDSSDFPVGITVHLIRELVRAVRPADDVRARLALGRLIREHDFDVVHTHQSKAGILGRQAARRRAPLVVHTVHMPSFGPGYAPYLSRVFLALERRYAVFTDVMVTVGSELLRRYVAARIGRPEQYVVIPSPVDVDAFGQLRTASHEDRARWRAQLALRDEEEVVVALGVLVPRKRYELMLRELAPLLRGGSTTLLIAGEGPLEAALAALAASLGIERSVRFLGYVPDVTPLLGVARALVHTSEVEGAPQAVIQALAAGVPVVATEVEGLYEVEGAPVDQVDRRGHLLADALSRRLEVGCPHPVPLGALGGWRRERVEERLRRLHDSLEERLVERRASHPRIRNGQTPSDLARPRAPR